MGRIESESFWLIGPDFADVLIGREALQSLEALGEVVGSQEEIQVSSQPIMAVVKVTPNGGFLDRPVHPFDLPICPRMVGLGEPVVDVGLGTGVFEGVGSEQRACGQRSLDLLGCRVGASGRRELGAVVGQHGVDLVRHRFNQTCEELGSDAARGSRMELGEGELGHSVDGDEQMELAFLGAHLGDVDMDIADRIVAEPLLRLLALHAGQPVDAVALEQPVQAGAGQVRDGRLQRIETVVQRQQCVLAEGDDHRLLLPRKHRRAPVLRPHWGVLDEAALAPLLNGLRVDPVTRAQLLD